MNLCSRFHPLLMIQGHCSNSLSCIFSFSFSTRPFLSTHRYAVISPMLKTAAATTTKTLLFVTQLLFSIYCPLSLLPFTPKLLEEVVYVKVAGDFHIANFSGWFLSSVYLTDQQYTAQSISSASNRFFTWCDPSFLLDLTVSFLILQLLILSLLEDARA